MSDDPQRPRVSSILLVDDQPHIVRVLSRALSREGYQVTAASHGEQALGLLGERDFDVLMTDYQMPRMDGRKLCQALRSDTARRQPYIILVTAVADEELRDWVDQQSDIRYMEKPVSIRQVRAMLDSLRGEGAR